MKDTNLQHCMDVAKMLLYQEPRILKMYIVSHPIIQCFMYPAEDYKSSGKCLFVNNEDDLRQIRANISKMIDSSDNYRHLFQMISNPYKATFFKLTEEYLSDKDFSQSLASAWMLSEFPNGDTNVSIADFVRFFKRANKDFLMTKSEICRINHLPDIVTVYRGLQRNSKLKGMSWTLDLEVAKWFANRFGHNGLVYQAMVQKKDILAYFDGRNEKEIIVDPKRLSEITLVNK